MRSANSEPSEGRYVERPIGIDGVDGINGVNGNDWIIKQYSNKKAENMAQKTKTELKNTLVNGHLVTGSDFADLVDSLKGVQTAVSSPAESGRGTSFIATVEQDKEGKITATKRSVDFDGYVPIMMLATYQDRDRQEVVGMTVAVGNTEVIRHGKGHFPTVRVLDENGREVDSSKYEVEHTSYDEVMVRIDSGMSGVYRYVLD